MKAQRSFLEILFSGKSNLVNVTSQSATPSFLGIAKPLNGAIYIIHFDDRRENSLWVFKSPFLFADSAVTILHKYLPLQRFATITLGYLSLLHDAYLCSGKKGFIVVQGGSEVVKKTLVSKEESIMVSANSLVAVEASCAIEMLSFSPAFLSFTFQDTVSFVKVTGPGTVYMSANSRRQSSSPYGEATPTVGTRIAVAIIFTLLTLYISLMVMSKFTENLENLLDEEMLAKLHNNLIPPA